MRDYESSAIAVVPYPSPREPPSLLAPCLKHVLEIFLRCMGIK